MGGASSSTGDHPSPSPEQQEAESFAGGSLPILRVAFAHLAGNSSSISISSLQESLSFPSAEFQSVDALPVPPKFGDFVSHLGKSIARFFLDSTGGKGVGGGVDWLGFLNGYNRCCARAQLSASLNLLFGVYAAACRDAGIDCIIEFPPDDSGGLDSKVGGSLGSAEVVVFLWMCWLMTSSSMGRLGRCEGEKQVVMLPNVKHLVLSALVSAGVVADDDGIWNCDPISLGKSILVPKFQSWVITTASGLGLALSQYVQERIRSLATAFEDNASSSSGKAYPESTDKRYLLTPENAWAMSLTLRSSVSETLLAASFGGMDPQNLLYRSSVHGKGMGRFWSKIEGYNAPVLIILSATSPSSGGEGSNKSNRRWLLGMLTEEGFANRDTFYGSTGLLYAVHPVFRVLMPAGKSSNFIYCHLRPTVRLYDARPKPIGLGFGGIVGNERIFIDEDFATVTVRHHAVDKTYQPGSLVPNQGFLAVDAPILEIEAWGFGSESAKEQQDFYKKRENIFSEQRRKVDLKTFGSWEDSPEKMMMDMVSDPNRIRREDR